MASRAIKALERLISERQAKVEEWQTDIEALTRSLDILRAEEGDGDSVEETQAKAMTPAKSLRNAMEEILNDAGEPMHYGAIHDELIARGVPVSGRDPKKNVSAHLSNDDRFVAVGSGKWGLRRWANADSERKPTEKAPEPLHKVVHGGWMKSREYRSEAEEEDRVQLVDLTSSVAAKVAGVDLEKTRADLRRIPLEMAELGHSVSAMPIANLGEDEMPFPLAN